MEDHRTSEFAIVAAEKLLQHDVLAPQRSLELLAGANDLYADGPAADARLDDEGQREGAVPPFVAEQCLREREAALLQKRRRLFLVVGDADDRCRRDDDFGAALRP